MGADVVADNWGGFFDGGDDTDEQDGRTRSMAADNCGGLLEQPAHIQEARNWGGEFEQHDAYSPSMVAAFPSGLGEPSPRDLDLSIDIVFAVFESAEQIRSGSDLTSTNSVASVCFTPVQPVSATSTNVVASACSMPVPTVSAAAAAASIEEKEPEESFRAELQHQIQEIEVKMQVANIAALEEGLSTRHLLSPNQDTGCKLESDFRDWDVEAKRARTPAVIITWDLDPRDADRERAYVVHISPVKCTLRATLLGGYDSSLDDDPESGVVHIDVPLDRTVGRIGHGQAFAAATALRADAVGAAGGGQLACVAAMGSALTTMAVTTSSDAVEWGSAHDGHIPEEHCVMAMLRGWCAELCVPSPASSLLQWVLVMPVEVDKVPSTLPNRCLMNCLILMQGCFLPPFRCSWDAVLYKQHMLWTPPTELLLVTCDVGVRPLPWPSFNMVERYSVLSHSGRLWKFPWIGSLRQLIMCVIATAHQKNLTCMPVLSVNTAGCVLILEQVQRKCGGNCQRFLLEVSGQKSRVAEAKTKDRWLTKQDLLQQILSSRLSSDLRGAWHISVSLRFLQLSWMSCVWTGSSVVWCYHLYLSVSVSGTTGSHGVVPDGLSYDISCGVQHTNSLQPNYNLTSVHVLDTHWAAPCLLGTGLNGPAICRIVFQPCFVASKLPILYWMLMAATQLKIICDGAQLRPIPWPSFSTVCEATAGWCFNLLVLPIWLPSAWCISGYQSEVLWHNFLSSYSDTSVTTISSSVSVLHLYPQAASSCKHYTVLRGLVIKWPQVLVHTIIAIDLLTWDLGAKHVLFVCRKPYQVLELQHESYCLVLIPRNVSCLETTLVSVQRSMVRTFHWYSGGDMAVTLRNQHTSYQVANIDDAKTSKIILTGQSLWLTELPFYHLLVEDP